LCAENKKCAIQIIGWPDQFIPHGTDVKTIREQFGLGTTQIAERIAENAKKLGVEIK